VLYGPVSVEGVDERKRACGGFLETGCGAARLYICCHAGRCDEMVLERGYGDVQCD